MDETHTEVTAGGRKRELVREPERPAVGALTVRTERHADVLVIWLSGALDKATAALLDREFDDQAGHAPHVVVDVTGLELIDSSGLETLVRTERRACENNQRTSFRHGPYAGRLPHGSATTPTSVSSRRLPEPNVQTNETFFAYATVCAEVDHQRPLVIDPEAPWMGA